ncbi:zinc-binding dehydrogenase [Streptomyces nigra]
MSEAAMSSAVTSERRSPAARPASGMVVMAVSELGVPDSRICTIAAQVDGVAAANGANAAPGALEEIASLVAAGRLRVPIAATFPIHEIRRAAELQAGRHVQGKIVIDL